MDFPSVASKIEKPLSKPLGFPLEPFTSGIYPLVSPAQGSLQTAWNGFFTMRLRRRGEGRGSNAENCSLGDFNNLDT